MKALIHALRTSKAIGEMEREESYKIFTQNATLEDAAALTVIMFLEAPIEIHKYI